MNRNPSGIDKQSYTGFSEKTSKALKAAYMQAGSNKVKKNIKAVANKEASPDAKLNKTPSRKVA